MMIVQISAESADLTVTMRCGGGYNPSVFDDLRRHAVATYREIWETLPDTDDAGEREPVVVEETIDAPAEPPEA